MPPVASVATAADRRGRAAGGTSRATRIQGIQERSPYTAAVLPSSAGPSPRRPSSRRTSPPLPRRPAETAGPQEEPADRVARVARRDQGPDRREHERDGPEEETAPPSPPVPVASAKRLGADMRSTAERRQAPPGQAAWLRRALIGSPPVPAATATRAPAAASRAPRRAAPAQRSQIHLVAQARRERLERALGVVLAPEEAAVDRRLDARSGRAEQSRDGEGRAGDREARVAGDSTQQQLQEQHAAQVGGGEDRGQRAVDQRAVDHDVDVVQAVAQDRVADRDRQCREGGLGERGDQVCSPCCRRSSRGCWEAARVTMYTARKTAPPSATHAQLGSSSSSRPAIAAEGCADADGEAARSAGRWRPPAARPTPIRPGWRCRRRPRPGPAARPCRST